MNCTAQLVLISVQGCVKNHNYLILDYFIALKRNLTSISNWSSCSPPPLSGYHESPFCFYQLPYSEHFTLMGSHTMWPFVPGFCYSALCLQGSSIAHISQGFILSGWPLNIEKKGSFDYCTKSSALPRELQSPEVHPLRRDHSP